MRSTLSNKSPGDREVCYSMSLPTIDLETDDTTVIELLLVVGGDDSEREPTQLLPRCPRYEGSNDLFT
jgi:hypothetical protein